MLSPWRLPFAPRHASYFTLVLVAVLFGRCGVATGQTPAPSSGSQQQTLRPTSGAADFFEVLESGGDLLVGLVRPDEKEPTVDDPRWNSLKSPRDTVMTFLEAMRHVEHGRSEAWPRAEKAFSMPADSDRDIREVAARLKEIFDRLPKVSPGLMPGPEQVNANDIRRFELFPRALDHKWLWEALDSPPDGTIVLAASEDGQWRFTPATIRQIPGLASSLTGVPPRTHDNRRGELFLNTFSPALTETPWWGWVSIVAGIGGGILLARLFMMGFEYLARRCETRDWYVLARAWRAVGRPMILLCIALGALVGSGPVELGVTLSAFRWELVKLTLVVALSWLVVEAVDLLVIGSRQWLTNGDDNYIRMGTVFLRRVLRVAVAIVLAVFVLQNLLQVNLTALLGGLGLITLAFSLAAQDAVKNLFGATMVFMSRPFLVGDWVKFRDRLGEVEDVSLQVTRIRLLSGELWTVPNMNFTEEPVENLSLRFYKRREMNVQIPYDTPPQKIAAATRILHEVLTSDEVVSEGFCRLEEREPVISFHEFGSYYYNIRVYYWYFMSEGGDKPQRETDRGWFSYLEHCDLVNRRIVEAFEKEGIEFAFPTQSLFLANDPERGLRLTEQQASQNGETGHPQEQMADR
ncbi:Low conductance mechanosensitive channel YnaI [Maioricimonas rarisocia]|uniref:Low conductance mechanosensitive channel YnaI n=1 Tax=Maioricimonas rarisocia TaxID=2528026 RepID=A0A517Z5D3_9PLAN|nr:mechanosensitive ion channel domain-containing protein [Maioricimonas rarisocia]QDU37674.1 Low conductance mechanosensitive channel YnaI [Maioricimonas rarisocia]